MSAAPTLAITTDIAALKAGETATITFTFSADPGVSFSWDGSAGDVVVSGGTLGAISGSGMVRYATFTPTAGTNNGTASITVAAGTYTDVDGNAGEAGASPPLTFDTLPPTQTFSDLSFSADTGSSAFDFVTKTAAQTISATLSGALGAGDVLLVSLNSGATWDDITSYVSGSSLAWSGVTLSGSNTLELKVVDAAGNNGPTFSQAYVLDTLPPTQTFSGLTFSADTGASSSDFITKTASQTISATLSGALAAGEMLLGSLDNGVTWDNLNPYVSGSSLAWTNVILSGSNTLKLEVVDAAGNEGTVLSQAYVLDTAAPSAPSTPDMTAGSDTGTSSSDNITKQDTPTFTGTAEAGATVTLYDTDGTTVIGTTVATGGNWTINSLQLSPGGHNITATATDTAGNVSVVSPPLAISVDTTAPTLFITTSASTLKAGETATITFTFNEDPGSTFTWDGTSGDVTVSGGTLSAISGSGLTRSATFTPTALTNNGTASITVASATYTDTAGNNGGAGTTPSLTFDTLAPTLAITTNVPTLKAGDAATITFAFSEDPGASFSAGDISVSGGTLGSLSGSGTTRTATFTPTPGTNNGTASITVASGTYTDAAGNGGGAGTTPSLTFDTLAPTLSITSDVSTLKIGETATITFSFSEDPGSSFTWNGSTGDVTVSGGTLSAISGSGLTRSATFTPTALTNNGTASITVASAAYTDTFGNVGGAGTTPSLTFDTLAPNAPSTPDLTAASDSGAVNTDNVTSVTTPTFTGTAEAGATVKLYDTNGTTLLGTGVATGGTWSITTSALAGGVHTITAKATDAAGNVSTANAGLAVTIDVGTPAAPGAPVLSPASDTGSIGDNRTSIHTPTITGTAAANALVKLYEGATLLGTATADNAGGWSIASSELGIGRHTLTATQTNLAGTTSAASAQLSLTIALPEPPVVTPPVVTPPVVTPPSPVAVIQAANVATGVDLGSSKALNPTVTLADGTVIANWVHQIALQAQQLQAQYSAGQISASQAQASVIQLGFPTRGMVIEVYDFFTGGPPTAAGLTYLIDSPANPNDLTDAYFAAFNPVNRYINFSVNLGSVGDGRAAFQAAYGSLTFEQTVATAYDAIIGNQRAVAAGYDPTAGQAYLISQKSYFQALGGSELGAKAAVVGALLSIAADAHLGPYYQLAHDAIGGQIQLVGSSSSLMA